MRAEACGHWAEREPSRPMRLQQATRSRTRLGRRCWTFPVNDRHFAPHPSITPSPTVVSASRTTLSADLH
jgi:hypothetical protein